MICVIALIVFGILSIFSATHRKLAAEAFDCTFRKLTLRKCESNLDVRLKSQIVGKIISRSPRTAKFVYKHFELLSWAFLLLFIASTVYVIIGGYNFYLYGNCNGPNAGGFCIFDPTGENSKFSMYHNGDTCAAQPPNPKYLTLANVDLSIFPSFQRNQKNDVIFIGCYSCPYTREAWPTIRRLLELDSVNFVFAHLPAKKDTNFISNVLTCAYEMDKQKFINLNEKLFATDTALLSQEDEVLKISASAGFDLETMKSCSKTNATIEITEKQLFELNKIGVYGTPTVFVNGNAVVGPNPYRVYSRLLK